MSEERTESAYAGDDPKVTKNPKDPGERRTEPGPKPTATGTDGITDLLLVGTFAGGGIHQYVERQRDQLPSRFDISVYDMVSGQKYNGPLWVLEAALRALIAALKFPFRTPPDIVHVHTSHSYSFYRASFYVFVAKFWWRRPVVLHVHGSSFDVFLQEAALPARLWQRAVFAASDRIIVLSAYWREALAERANPEKVIVLPNAVDPTLYDPEYGTDPPRIVFVSALVNRKGVSELIESVRTLLGEADVSVDVDIAGDGPRREAVERLASEFEAVTYYGYVSETRKRELLNRGTVFVLPTHAEGLPIAILEAMAAGNAVLSTTVGSIPEVVTDDRGELVEPRRVDTLTATLASLAVDPDRAETMGRTNRRTAAKRYSWDRVADDLVDVYRQSCSAAVTDSRRILK